MCLRVCGCVWACSLTRRECWLQIIDGHRTSDPFQFGGVPTSKQGIRTGSYGGLCVWNRCCSARCGSPARRYPTALLHNTPQQRRQASRRRPSPPSSSRSPMLRNHTVQGHVDGSGGDASPLHSRRVGGGYLYDADQRDDHNDHGDTRPNHRRPAEDSRPAPGPAGSPDRGRNAGEASGGPGSANASTRDGDAGAITRVAAGSETTQRAHRHHHRHSHRSHHSHPQRSQAATTARAEAVDEANRAARAAAKAAQAAAAILASFDNEGDGDESDAFLAELGLDVGVDLVGAASGDAGSAGGTGGGDGDGTPNAGLASATALSPVATPNRNRRPAHTSAASPGPGGAGSHTGDDGGGHDDSWQGGDDSFVQELLSDFPRSGDPAIDGAIQGLSSFTARLPPSNHKRGAASQGAASPAARLHAPPSPGQRLAASSPARPQLSSGATASECVAVGSRCSARSSTCGGMRCGSLWCVVRGGAARQVHTTVASRRRVQVQLALRGVTHRYRAP